VIEPSRDPAAALAARRPGIDVFEAKVQRIR